MVDPARRKELIGQFNDRSPDAGVYRIVNVATGRLLVGSTSNLQGAANRLAFAQSSGSLSALDHRLVADAGRDGLDSLRFEVLDRLASSPGASDTDVRADLATLEQLWRDRFDPSELY